MTSYVCHWRCSGRWQTLFLKLSLNVLLLSCSWKNHACVSGSEATSEKPAIESRVLDIMETPEVEFLKQFMIGVVEEAMKDQGIRCVPDEELQLLVLSPMEGKGHLHGTHEKSTEVEKKILHSEKTPPHYEDVSIAEVKKSAAEVYRDHKLKTLFRWGKRKAE